MTTEIFEQVTDLIKENEKFKHYLQKLHVTVSNKSPINFPISGNPWIDGVYKGVLELIKENNELRNALELQKCSTESNE